MKRLRMKKDVLSYVGSKMQHTDQENCNKSDNNKLTRRLKKFGENSSFSLVLEGFRSKSRYVQVFWALVIVAVTVAFLAITIQEIRTLAQGPTATTIKEVRETSLEFPAVTICSLGVMNTTKLAVIGSNISQTLNAMYESAQATPPNRRECDILASQLHNNSEILHNNSYGELVTEIAGLNLTDLIISCDFIGKDCSKSFTPVKTLDGVCIQFNGPETHPIRKVQGTGVRQGLRLQLLNDEDQFFSISNDYGYKVVIHNQNQQPRPISEGIAVGLNSVAYVSMRRVESVDRTSRRTCIDDPAQANFDAKLAFGNYSTYTSSLCLNDCYHTTQADRCGCISNTLYTPIRPPYTQMRTCNILDLCCATIGFETFNATCDCPQECKVVQHTLTVSSSTSIQQRTVGVNVYYETLTVENRETRDSYTPFNLISDVGGNSGLFHGLSVLSVAELVVLACGLGRDCCRSKNMCSRCVRCGSEINEAGGNGSDDSEVEVSEETPLQEY